MLEQRAALPSADLSLHTGHMLNTNLKKKLLYYGCGVLSGLAGADLWRKYQFNPVKAETRLVLTGTPGRLPAAWHDTPKVHDVHVHFSPGYSKQSHSMRKFIKLLDEANIGKAVWMPIPTNIHQPYPYKTSPELTDEQNMLSLMCGNCGSGMHYYLPQEYRTGEKQLGGELDVIKKLGEYEQYYDLSVDDISAMAWMKLTPQERERIVVMLVGFHLTDANSVRYILKKMRRHPGVFKGIGEISAQKEIVSDQLATKYKPTVRNPVLGQLVDVFGYIGFPVVFHCDVDDFPQEGGEPAQFEAIKSFFISHPKTTIIWAHAGGLGRFVQPSENHVELLQEILEDARCAHVHIDLSWDVVAKVITKDADTSKKWAALIERYPDRFLYGSDSLEAKDEVALSRTYAIYDEHLFPLLSEPTADQVKRGNFERIFSSANLKVREFEKTVLPRLRTSSVSNDWIEIFDESKKKPDKH
jgi:hypothetical protein